MSAFEVFVSSSNGVFTKKSLNTFYSSHVGELSGVAAKFAGLDDKVTVTLAPPFSPLPRFNQAVWTATQGQRAADKNFAKVKDYYDLLTALERIFNPNLTGAFEVAQNRVPQADGVFTFATKKFTEDHICDRTAKKPSQWKEKAEAVGQRRMLTPAGGFSTIPVSTTMVLNQEKDKERLVLEVRDRQKEYAAVYKHLTEQDTRLVTLMEGDHEEVIFTSLGTYQMYEVQRPSVAGNPLIATSEPGQHLRYAVQKVSTKWLIHHMAGHCLAQNVNTPPGGFAAFDNTVLGTRVTGNAGTFRRTG